MLVVKSVLAAVIVGAVGWQFARTLRSPELWEHEFSVRHEYLIPAGFLYLAAHTLWGTFWWQLLRSQGAHVPWIVGIRAYFVSQFGKYVPGKAWVLVLRVGLLHGYGLSPATVAVTATYETLTSMAAGALLGICLLPWAGNGVGIQLDSGQGVALIGIAGLPLALGLLNRATARIAARRRGPDARPLPSPSLRLLAQGLLQDTAGWCLLGLSLWLTVRGLTGGDIPMNTLVFLQDLAAVSLAYVAGFVVLVSPGGLGAREFVLQQVLSPQLVPTAGAAADGLAVVIALVLRLVWTLFEVACAGSLWMFARPMGDSITATKKPGHEKRQVTADG
ncbi:hypothetical protein FRUB_00904 [Fimbriiglobus ruber]|uniref:Flippase-like domain-containing protein n=1 Tax=Fimbriiglobus ruber TaxID=1908690 RepID=A0A225EFT1_9BACT|nr:hypothetical protein FRUB_00904 [Fimbriiglobus ruber]